MSENEIRKPTQKRSIETKDKIRANIFKNMLLNLVEE